MTPNRVAEIERIRRQTTTTTPTTTEEVIAACHRHQRTRRPANFTREM